MQLLFQLLVVIPSFCILSFNLIFGQKSTTFTSRLTVDSLNHTLLFDINNIKLPINNKGFFSNVGLYDSLGYNIQSEFEESTFLYSGGFLLSGLNNNTIWGNGSGPYFMGLIDDYLPGNIMGELNDPHNRIFVLQSSDPPFSDSWNDWKLAVSKGAEFYDGNGDGIYDPIDINDNGQWDSNEDRPNLVGDLTAWCTYNDGVTQSDREFGDTPPLGIQINQTVYAFSGNTSQKLSNVIFIKYSIENSGKVNNVFDSVYFGAWSDPDLGYYDDDLVGSDSLLNLSFCYNDGYDEKYGQNPPAFITAILQGPISFLPNISFIDNNENKIYDEGIDIPLDTASQNLGEHLGIRIFAGAANLGITAFTNFIQSSIFVGEATNSMELKNFLQGKNLIGDTLDPCKFPFGEIVKMDCNSINPILWYSGDPINESGWLCSTVTDQKILTSTGPFVLEKGKPQEIIIAYIVGRGSDPLNSITVAKEMAKDVIGFYESNFTEIPVNVKESKTDKIPTDFFLEQNYPNPFNPSTVIRYQIPSPVDALSSVETQNAKLIVYDILGREISTLINKEHNPGNYKIEFDANNLSSGVYYYQLTLGNLIQTKKMILLK